MKELNIDVDKRSEIMDILLYLSNYRKEYPNLILFDKDIKYVSDVYNHFNKFTNHKAVSLLNEIVEKHNFCYDAPYILAMQLNEDLSVGELLPYPFKTRLKGDKLILGFLNEIQDFAKKSDFEEFYKNHKDYYQGFVKQVDLGEDFISKFQEFYRLNSDMQYVINFLPLSARGGAFYDWYGKNKFTIYFQNHEKDDFSHGFSNGMQRRVFHLFTLSLLRKCVEEGELKFSTAKEFDSLRKERYVAYNNIGYICGDIAVVLRGLFKEKYSDAHVSAQETIENYKFENKERAFKVLEILREWQKSNKPLDKYLQKVLDLF